jgi:hypothetical protein
MYGRLMNESIARSRTRGSLKWREETMMVDCSSTLDLSIDKSLYHPQTSMSQNSTSDECKECSLEKLNKEHIESNLKTLSHTRRRLLYAEDNMVENLQCTAEAW